MRESWTDRRLDDLNDKVDRIDVDVRAHRVETRTEFATLREETKSGFDRVDARFERMDERMDDRFDALHRLLLQISGLIVTALIGLIASQL